MLDLAQAKSVLLQSIQLAGDAILKMQKTGFTVFQKENKDLVTQADLTANHILQEHLCTQFPEHGWLSEESKDDSKRLKNEYVWIVDPIDGTKEFASGLDEYAISVALTLNNKPILAAIFNPAKNELFFASKNEGAWLNEQRIFCTPVLTDPMVLLASRTEMKRGEWAAFSQHSLKPLGSIAYKLALIASGAAHGTFSLGPKNEWDIAAGVLVLEEAGGIVTDKTGESLKFNQASTLTNGIIGTSMVANEAIRRLIGQSACQHKLE